MEKQEIITLGDSASGAVFSVDEQYRYTLHRVWDYLGPTLAVIGLNPSTATHEVNDPTIAKLTRIAKARGYGGILMLNLFAFRATDPNDMKRADEPVGKFNDYFLASRCNHISQEDGRILLAWGNGPSGGLKGRDKQVIQMLTNDVINSRHIITLGRNKNMTPKHPLYLKETTRFQQYYR